MVSTKVLQVCEGSLKVTEDSIRVLRRFSQGSLRYIEGFSEGHLMVF